MRVKVADFRAGLSQFLAEVRSGHVVVEKHGRPVAVLISMQEHAELKRLRILYTTQPAKALASTSHAGQPERPRQ